MFGKSGDENGLQVQNVKISAAVDGNFLRKQMLPELKSQSAVFVLKFKVDI